MDISGSNPQQLIALAAAAIDRTPPGVWKDDLIDSLEMYKAGTNRMRIFYLLMLKKYPVDIDTFLFDPQYMNAKGHIWPELLPYIREVNNPDGDRLGLKYHEVVLTGGIGCFDAETEYMSPTGWRKISEYDGGPVLQYHADNSTSWVDTPEFVKLPCTHFLHFKTDEMDQMLSGEHRVVYHDWLTGALSVKTAAEIADMHWFATGGFKGLFRTTFGMPDGVIPEDCKPHVDTSSCWGELSVRLSGKPKDAIRVVEAVDGYKYCFTVPTGMLVVRRNGKVVVSGNTAKTTQALYGLAYQLYLLSCYREPHMVLGQDPSAEILFIFQSINSKVAKNDYMRFRHMIERSVYFRDEFNFKRDIETTMIFPHRIEVQPVTGEVNATIGQNVLGGLLDEVNFMIRTKKSKKVQTGEFDQATELYNSIDSRRKSRFMELGCVPGLLFMCSSKNYPGQFTDQKEIEAKTNPGIFFWDKRVWDLRPNKFLGPKFWVFIGDITSQPYVISQKRPAPPDAMAKGLLDQIPVEYKSRFETDIYLALREIAGKSTLSTSPYIPNTNAIARSFKETVKSLLEPNVVDFETIRPTAYGHRLLNRTQPRAVHIDLALNGDLAGISCGYVEKFVTIEDEGETYMMPIIRYDFILGVKAPAQDDINFGRIRKMILDLNVIFGLPIKWISFDTFQSKDSQQILRQKGFIAGEVSMDVTPLPYDCFKTAINQGRIVAPTHELAQLECTRLERGPDGKIDHPADGSKDLSDSMAGVCYVLTMRKEIWMMHGVQPSRLVRDVSRKID